MSLLKWKELAKSKSELGNKINYVHNAITNMILVSRPVNRDFQKYSNQLQVNWMMLLIVIRL